MRKHSIPRSIDLLRTGRSKIHAKIDEEAFVQFSQDLNRGCPNFDAGLAQINNLQDNI